jgi:hypothetical protein
VDGTLQDTWEFALERFGNHQRKDHHHYGELVSMRDSGNGIAKRTYQRGIDSPRPLRLFQRGSERAPFFKKDLGHEVRVGRVSPTLPEQVPIDQKGYECHRVNGVEPVSNTRQS